MQGLVHRGRGRTSLRRVWGGSLLKAVFSFPGRFDESGYENSQTRGHLRVSAWVETGGLFLCSLWFLDLFLWVFWEVELWGSRL